MITALCVRDSNHVKITCCCFTKRLVYHVVLKSVFLQSTKLEYDGVMLVDCKKRNFAAHVLAALLPEVTI